MPETNVLYSVTAAVVVGLLAWVAVVMKTAQEPWAREAPPAPPEGDVPVEGAAVEAAEPGAEQAEAKSAADEASDEAKDEPAKDEPAKDEPAKDEPAGDAAAK